MGSANRGGSLRQLLGSNNATPLPLAPTNPKGPRGKPKSPWRFPTTSSQGQVNIRDAVEIDTNTDERGCVMEASGGGGGPLAKVSDLPVLSITPW
jgi:hypothetical protein